MMETIATLSRIGLAVATVGVMAFIVFALVGIAVTAIRDRSIAGWITLALMALLILLLLSVFGMIATGQLGP